MTTGLLHLLAAIAATVGLVAVAGIVKASAFFINLLVPFPIVLLTMRRGVAAGLAAATASTALLALGGDLLGPLLYLVQFGLASVLLPHLLRRGWNWDRTVAVTLTAILGAVLLAIGYQAASQGVAINDLVKSFTTGEIAQVKDFYGKTGDLTADQRTELFAALDKTGEFMTQTWPALVALLGGALLLIQVVLLSSMPGTRALVPGPDFIAWKTPEWLVWPLIAAGFAAFLTEGTLRIIAFNLLVVLIPVYYVQGLAIVTNFFQRRGTPPWLRVIGYLLLSLLNPLPVMVAGLGLFDLWFDFRKPRVQQNTP